MRHYNKFMAPGLAALAATCALIAYIVLAASGGGQAERAAAGARPEGGGADDAVVLAGDGAIAGEQPGGGPSRREITIMTTRSETRAAEVFDPNEYNPFDHRLIEQFRAEGAAVKLIGEAQSVDARARVAARKALSLDRDRRAAELEAWLATYRDAGCADERILAIRGTKQFGVDKFRELLLTIASNDAAEAARTEAFIVLSPALDDATRIAGLKDAHWTVRNAVLATINSGLAPSPEIEDAVRARTGDESAIVRSRAERLIAAWSANAKATKQ